MKITTMLDLPIANINDAVCFMDFGTTPTRPVRPSVPDRDKHPVPKPNI